METNHLICCANQMTGFYMVGALPLKSLAIAHCSKKNVLKMLEISREAFVINKY